MKAKQTKAVEITPAKRIRYNMEFKSLKDKNKFIKNLTEIKQQLKIK
jgi:predicted RNA-binding protein